MFKLLLIGTLFFTSLTVMASPEDQILTMKERLRLSLWIEGIEEQVQDKSHSQTKRDLPEEIERPLRKL